MNYSMMQMGNLIGSYKFLYLFVIWSQFRQNGSDFFVRARVFVCSCSSSLGSLIILQQRAIRIRTFSKPDELSESLFKELEILTLSDLVTLHNTILMHMYQCCNDRLPSSFDIFFKQFTNSPVQCLASFQIDLYQHDKVKFLKVKFLKAKFLKVCRSL